MKACCMKRIFYIVIHRRQQEQLKCYMQEVSKFWFGVARGQGRFDRSLSYRARYWVLASFWNSRHHQSIKLSYFSLTEALWIVLRQLPYPHRYCDMRSVLLDLGLTFHSYLINVIFLMRGLVGFFSSSDQAWLTSEKLNFANPAHNKAMHLTIVEIL